MTLPNLQSSIKSQIMQELNCNEFTMNKLWQWSIERSVQLSWIEIRGEMK